MSYGKVQRSQVINQHNTQRRTETKRSDVPDELKDWDSSGLILQIPPPHQKSTPHPHRINVTRVSKGNKGGGTNEVAAPEQNNTNGHSELTLRGTCACEMAVMQLWQHKRGRGASSIASQCAVSILSTRFAVQNNFPRFPPFLQKEREEEKKGENQLDLPSASRAVHIR